MITLVDKSVKFFNQKIPSKLWKAMETEAEKARMAEVEGER